MVTWKTAVLFLRGFAGLIQSHLLSTEVAGGLTIRKAWGTVMFPAGSIEVEFVGLRYWRAAEIISLITVIYFLWAIWRKREKHEKVQQTGLI